MFSCLYNESRSAKEFDMLTSPLTTSLKTFLSAFSEHEGEEWISGEWMARIRGGFLHSLIIKRLFVLLLALEQQGLGEVYQETAFVVTPPAQCVKGSRIPDVMYTKMERLTSYRQNTPDLAIEVISPNDQYVDVVKKADLYLQDGVQRVWLVEPQSQIITVQSAGSTQQIYRVGDTLTEDGLLPGLGTALRALFDD